ncbi:MAG: MBL fold metallo-hydrolase [Methanobacteriaceae archaeon]|nr:MBL fold metallo-hydrolase [Methanobacteriaceae archaeon]MDO9626811.1 MBL fold metallo-hydrolase [Methanobacteriaceae archaeon]
MIESKLRPADRVEITVLIDNYVDMLLGQNSKICQRPTFSTEDIFMAEHGLACVIKVFEGCEEHIILMDFGISSKSLLHNAKILNIDLEKIDVTVLSHGHFDHTGGIFEFMNQFNGTPLIIHPDAFLQRRLNNPDVGPVDRPKLEEESLKEAGAVIVKSEGPTWIASDLVMVTGQVERKTSFEKGFPWAEAKIDGEWIVDPINDDQGIVINLKNKGLIVISGCAHAGIINTVKYSQKIAQNDKVHAVLGGFHLTGPLFESIIQPTIDEMKRINPDYVVPMHCTGWDAINQFKAEMPDQVILNTVGTTYIFE